MRRTRPAAAPGSHAVEGEGNHGGESGQGGESGGSTGSQEVVDQSTLPGPYTFDVVAGTTVLEQVAVVPGTFDRVDLRYVLAEAAPLAGSSIRIVGVYDDGTTSVPFELHSAFVGRTHVPIANGGITVTENSVVPVELAFDLTSMLGGLDFTTAVVDGGEITIDGTHNTALLAAFEATLGVHGCIGAHEHHAR